MTNIIYPAAGEASQVARDLLSLARSPYDVATNTDNGMAFVVPDYLAAAYLDAVAIVEPEPGPTGGPKRSRRPRKES